MNFRLRQIALLALLIGLCCCSGAGAADYWKDTHWLPEGVSSYSKDIDALFYFILVLTGVVFVGTEGALVFFLVKYRKKEGEKSYYTHGNHKLEMIWTIAPAVILIVIALIQAKTWNQIKDPSTFADNDPNASINDYIRVQMFAKQFEWHFRYPAIVDGKDASGKPVKQYKFGVDGSFTVQKKLTVPKGKKVIVEMTSLDVIHSFYLPFMRLKQDVVPGMMIKCWFDASKTTNEMRVDRPKMQLMSPRGKLEEREWDYPIICAELCGIQHYQMAGTVEVLEPKEYDEWRKKTAEQAAQVEASNIWGYWKVDPETQQRMYGEDNDNKRSAFNFKNEEEGGH
ncbi:MAG TPA: cytochrome c oxidase subunit II [Planctomycetota bacterium]|nr:cytochrome c oxidase subunit II [Planctomycetota bacterium]